MLTKITTAKNLVGKTIEATETNVYGMVIKFTDNTYVLFKPTISEEIALDTFEESSVYRESFNILKQPSINIDPEAIQYRTSNRFSEGHYNLKLRELEMRYLKQDEMFTKAIEAGNLLLSVREQLNDKCKNYIERLHLELRYTIEDLKREMDESIRQRLKHRCFHISILLHFYLEGVKE